MLRQITNLAEIANESGDSSWSGQIQPAQITEADRAGVVLAKGDYEGLTGDGEDLDSGQQLKKVGCM